MGSSMDCSLGSLLARKPKIPTHLHPSVKQFHLQITQAKKTHTTFLCEVPTVTGEYGAVTVPANFNFLYSPAPGHQSILKNNKRITQEN